MRTSSHSSSWVLNVRTLTQLEGRELGRQPAQKDRERREDGQSLSGSPVQKFRIQGSNLPSR